MCSDHQRQSSQPRCPAGCSFTRSVCSRLSSSVGSLMALCTVYCASCVCIDHNPPFFAFSSHFHFLKSIYEGNFGCGYLKERRASGLVFCENTASVYRALFVSSPVFSSLCLTETARMWTGASNAVCSVVE